MQSWYRTFAGLTLSATSHEQYANMRGKGRSVEARSGAKDVEEVCRGLDLPPGVTVRAWEEADFPAVQKLYGAEGWRTPIDRPDEALNAFRHSWPVLVAVADGSIIGLVRSLSDGAVTTYVAEVLVCPAWRGRGVGSALLDVCQRLCPRARLDLLCTEDVRSFYERRRFREFIGFGRSGS